MAKKSLIIRSQGSKYQTRNKHRCGNCGRARGFIGYFHLCRICFRELASEGKLPGVIKASW